MQTILILAVLVTVVNCEYYSPQKLKSVPAPVQYFYPYQNGCHQFYGGEETVSQYSCRSLDFLKMGCYNLSDAKRFTYQIRSPSDEIIEFIQHPFIEKLLPEGCYKVIGKEDKKSMVCQKSFGDNVTGITTPDNYTMLFTSPSCDAATSTWDMDKIKKFVADYKFDVDARSCYKVYDEGELPSPYTCLSDYIPESCVYRYNSSCLAITTSKNDTVLLSCQNEIDTQEDPEHKCFNVVASDGEVHEVCQKTFGEWCIGLKMPSGLTVLFECSFCQFGFEFRNEYNEEDLRNQRLFVKKWLADDYSGTKKRFDQTELIIFKPNETVIVYPFCNGYEINRLYPYWLPNTNCWGVDVNENERIMLECTSSKRTPGCFNIESNGDKQEVCLKIIHEKCVGVKTPLNYTLILDCNEGQNCFRETVYKYPFDVLSPEEYDKFPELEECFEIYDEEPTDYTCYKPTDLNNYACTTEIQHEGKTCYGFKTPKKETIMFPQCQDDQTEPVETLFQIGAAPKKTRNCFKVIQEDGAVEMVCPKRFGEVSIGITTSKNSSVLFKSLCQYYTSTYDLNDYKKFYKNYKFDPSVRSCFKVYEESENVSPFNCMSKVIKHACIHKLEYFEGCEGIVTQNNETILLDCKGRESLESGCFEVFTADGTRHIACQKQLEARCAGIITPSNLTVLFECSFCSSHPVGYLTPPDFRKTNRYFIARALTLFKTGNYSFNTKMDFRVCDDTSINSLAECYFMMKTYKVRPLPDYKNCLGTTLPNLETIIFECPDKSFVKNGCFDVFRPIFDSDGNFIVTEKVGNVCTQYLDEECVGLKTPGEWNVLLACITTNVFAQQENGTIWYQNLTDAS